MQDNRKGIQGSKDSQLGKTTPQPHEDTPHTDHTHVNPQTSVTPKPIGGEPKRTLPPEPPKPGDPNVPSHRDAVKPGGQPRGNN